MPPPRDVKKEQALSDDDKRVLANRYRVEKKLGSGNFGTAFLITDLKGKGSEAKKVLKEVSVGDMQADESIEAVNEANLLSKLDHPNILRYHDSFLDGEYFCIVTEYCEGGDLDVRFKKLKKDGTRLTEQKVLDWTVQLTSAVNYMHSRRVLHRDLKARNIFLKNEIIKIGDFGISRVLQGTMDMASTFTGTPFYMSPEVLKHEGYNSKSDVWSIGCLLYEMCTYQHAFEGQGLMGVMYKIVEGKAPELPNHYSKSLNAILKKIFRRDPAQRPSTSELLREPYLASHIADMISRLKESKAVDLESTLVIRNDREELAKAYNSKMSLKDLQMQRRPLSKVDEAMSEGGTEPANAKVIPVKATPVVAPTAVSTKITNGAVVHSPLPAIRRDEPGDRGDNTTDDDEDVRANSYKDRPKTSGTVLVRNTAAASTAASDEAAAVTMTPKERLLMNKLKKADEEAAKVGQIAKANYEEKIRQSFIREATIHGTTNTIPKWNPNYNQEQIEYEMQQIKIGTTIGKQPSANNQTYLTKQQPVQYVNSYRNEQQPQPREYVEAQQPNNYGAQHEEDDDHDGTILRTVQKYHPPHPYPQRQQIQQIPAMPQYSVQDYNNPEMHLQNTITLKNPIITKSVAYDTRPITPMKTKLENLNMLFDEDGIPIDPHLANEYYKNYQDFEYDSSPERNNNQTITSSQSFSNAVTRNSMSRTVVPNRRRVQTAVARKPAGYNSVSAMKGAGNKQPTRANTNNHVTFQLAQANMPSRTISGSHPSGSAAARTEYEQLIGVMQNVMADSGRHEQETFGDDQRTSVFGAQARATKIQNLRAQSIRLLGQDAFNKCYEYLRSIRLGPNANANHDENKIFESLKQFSANPSDCFLVDQLLFLEES